MAMEPEVVWKVVLIAAIGVELTEALNKTSSRLAAVELDEGMANVDRRAGALDWDAESEVEEASSLEIELG